MDPPLHLGMTSQSKAPALPLQSPRQQKRPRVAEENRQRAAKACNECRRLKEKCEGGFPCARCIRTKRTCGFDRSAPVNYGNRSVLGSGAQDERVKYLEKIATHFLGDISLSLPDLKRISEKLQSSQVTIPSETDAVDLNEFEDLKLEDETFTVKGLSQHTAHYSGEFSHWNFSKRVQKRVDEFFQEDDAENSKGIIDFWRATQLQSPDSTVLSVLSSLPPRPVVDFLIRIYFQYAQTNSFYVEEGWLRNKVEILYENSTNLSSSDSSWICAVLMVFAIGSQFAHMEAGPHENSASFNDLEGDNMYGEEEVGVAIYHMASKLIPDVITIASLESVQACLLLAHYGLPLDAHGISYTYLGLAMKLAVQNGMHRKYTGQDIDPVTVETRNRVWWTLYTTEKRIGVLHGRPFSISQNDVDAELPVDSPEFRDPDRPSNLPNMLALIHLVSKLGDMAQAISLLRKCPKRLQPHYFDRIFEIQHQFRVWWSTLPSSVVCRDIKPKSQLFRHNVHLTLCFHLNAIYMGRPFIFSDPKMVSPASDQSPNSKSLSSSRTRSRGTLVSDAVSAAIEIIKLCQLLEDNCGLARASYTEFTSCRAALLVILAQSLNERTERLETSLALGLKLIKGMAGNIASSQSDVSMIEALEIAIKRLESRDQSSHIQEKDTGYDQFKNWAMMWRNEQEEKIVGGPTTESAPTPQQGDILNNANWDVFGFDINDNAATASSMFQFDSQISGIGLDDILVPFQSQAAYGEIPDDQWHAGFSDLNTFGTGPESSFGKSI